jgi:chromosome segregation protein
MEKDREDLVSAISKLRNSINELDQKGRERLLDAFEKVNRKFNEVYTKLFNGGIAKLELVDSDDPLESGLELLVSPPGKRLQSISLLSGGEQALTAMSLIFAVFLTSPAPICILDEVDAPLDDANVTRFCALLDELTKITDTKFVIITHHALTMSRMDRLYGVTMSEKGISQLVSVDLQKAEELVA